MTRMGGVLELANAADVSLVAHLRLRKPTAEDLRSARQP